MGKILNVMLFILFFICQSLLAYDQYYCTAADSTYFKKLLNLIGSLHKTNFKNIRELVVFDLGLTKDEKSFLQRIDKVQIKEFEKRNPYILKFEYANHCGKKVPGWYCWKIIALKQCLDTFPYVLWLDAATTVLKPLDHLFEYIDEHGHFLCTIGDDGCDKRKPLHPIGQTTTRFVYNYFKLHTPENRWILSKESLMAGVVGVSRKAWHYFVKPLYDLTTDIRFFKDDGSTPRGFGWARPEQMLYSIHCYLNGIKTFKQYYRQNYPMWLTIHYNEKPLYITWLSHYVDSHTHIYSSRGDLKNFEHYKTCIHFRA